MKCGHDGATALKGFVEQIDSRIYILKSVVCSEKKLSCYVDLNKPASAGRQVMVG